MEKQQQLPGKRKTTPKCRWYSSSSMRYIKTETLMKKISEQTSLEKICEELIIQKIKTDKEMKQVKTTRKRIIESIK